MPLRILIAPDKFKGTLTARKAAAAIARGWRGARPDDLVHQLPVSDGGDGFGAALGEWLGARMRFAQTVDAAHRRCRSAWWWEPGSKTAVIESANVIGLALLPPKKFHPFELDTFGLGNLIRAASAQGARRCVLGIGGSATNDGGFGLACALGWQFLEANGTLIEEWTGLHKLDRIRAPKQRRWFRELIVAVDVQNPLLGSRGATRVYGPQKGMRKQDFIFAEKCLRRLAVVAQASCLRVREPSLVPASIRRARMLSEPAGRMPALQRGTELQTCPGAGAAGGLGFGLLAFLGARLVPGFDLFARFAGLDRQLHRADLVITGEGRIDSSTFMGKGVGQLARRCRQFDIPCLAFGGVIDESANVRHSFAHLHSLTDLTDLDQAKSRPAHWLAQLAKEVARRYPAGACEPGRSRANVRR